MLAIPPEPQEPVSHPTDRITMIAVIILTSTAALAILALVGAATFAIVINSWGWYSGRRNAPNLSSPLSILIGSIMSALIAGLVGYITGTRAARKNGPPHL